MYFLDCKKSNVLVAAPIEFHDIHIDIIRNTKYANIDELFDCKNKLEIYTKSGLGCIYRSARLFAFPEYGELGQQRNRAGTKIKEIFSEFPELSRASTFLDLCGGPGAWSLFMLEIENIRGYGFTINTPDLCRRWYKDLEEDHSNYTVLNVTDTNDICAPEVRAELSKLSVDLVLADGAPPEDTYPDENLQELYALHILYSEVVTAMNVLQDKGNFVIKVFDSFTNATKSLIYLILYNFNKVFIFKPQTSRSVNSERYLVCLGYKRKAAITTTVPLFQNILDRWENGKITGSLIPVHILNADVKFSKTYEHYIKESSKKQVDALQRVIQIMDDWTTNGNNKGKNAKKGQKGGKSKSKEKNDSKGKSKYMKGKGKGGPGYHQYKGKGPPRNPDPY